MHFLVAAAPIVPHGTLLERPQSLLGLISFTSFAFVIGRMRGARTIPWRIILWGTILEIVFGGIVLFAPHVLEAVQYATSGCSISRTSACA
jgi:nucleoside permease NupC